MHRIPDFVAYFDEMSTVWRIQAATEKARDFAREHFVVESWRGTPEDFYTDWRPAQNLCRTLAFDEGFEVARREVHGFSFMTPAPEEA